MTSLSTHVLDAVAGAPAADVPVAVYRATGPDQPTQWEAVGSATTDDDGRIGALAGSDLPFGTYQIVFDTDTYFSGVGTRAFYPQVAITFVVDEERHYHVPLLLSPYVYSTYRGS